MKRRIGLILLSILAVGIIASLIVLSRTEYRNNLLGTNRTETKASSNTVSWNISASSSDNVTATYDIDTEELIISGSGYMLNWSSASDVPWYDYVKRTGSYLVTPSTITYHVRGVTINSGVKNIGDYAFCGRNDDYINVRSLTIPNTVTSIGKYSFAGWCGLDSNLTIPSSVTTIGEYAFLEFRWSLNANISTRYITIPSSVTSIGLGAFAKISYGVGNGDVNVNLASGNSYYSTDGKVIFNKQKTELVQYVGNFYDYTIPSTVKTIKERAFYVTSSAYSLRTITIPNSVTSIEKEAFYYINLSDISIPNSVTYIGKDILKRFKFKLF